MDASSNVSIRVALIGALATVLVAVTGAYATSTATADARVNGIDTKVQLVERTQTLQYSELKDKLENSDKQQDDLKKQQDEIKAQLNRMEGKIDSVRISI